MALHSVQPAYWLSLYPGWSADSDLPWGNLPMDWL